MTDLISQCSLLVSQVQNEISDLDDRVALHMYVSEPAEPGPVVDPATKQVQLVLLNKLWVVNSLVKELLFASQQPFVGQYQLVGFNLNKLDAKLLDLKLYININHQLEAQSQAPTPDTVSVPGGFSGFSPDKLEAIDLDLAPSTGTDYASKVAIVRVLDARLAEFRQAYSENIAGLFAAFVRLTSTSVSVFKQVLEQDESLSLAEFFDFAKQENFKYSNAEFSLHLADVLLAANRIVGGRVKFEQDDFKYVVSSDGRPQDEVSAVAEFLQFFLQLPGFLKYELSNNFTSKVSQVLTTRLSVSIFEKVTEYNTGKSSKQEILQHLKLIYLLVHLKLVNKKDFYSFNLDSSNFTKLTTDDDVLALVRSTGGNEKLWASNASLLTEFYVDKRLNQVINDIKQYLHQFDTHDLIFHELVSRKDKLEPLAKPPVARHQRKASNASFMGVIQEDGESASVDTKLDSFVNKKKKNRGSVMGLSLNTPGNFSIDENLLEERGTRDSSYNQSALDALVGKNDLSVETDLKSGVASPISPVTPISPFSPDNDRFPSMDKKPSDDRKRFSKRFSKQDDAHSVHSGTSDNIKPASKRISKRLSQRFSLNDWSWSDDEEADDGWSDEIDVDLSADEDENEDLDDWGWGDEDADTSVNTVVTTQEEAAEEYRSTKIPEAIFGIINEFVEFLSDKTGAVNYVMKLLNIYHLIGGYAKYDSGYLFYNDIYHLNALLKRQLVSKRFLGAEDKLFDQRIEDFLTDIVNREKISFLKIYRKFQNFANLANTNIDLTLTQLEFKFKEMFFSGFKSLAKDLQHKVVINFLNEFYQLIINDILHIEMISEEDSDELTKIISGMLALVDFFGQSNDLQVVYFKKTISNYQKLRNFQTIVSSHLASIMESFYNGEFYNIETEELVHLLKATFAESDRRSKALQEIEEIRNIDI